MNETETDHGHEEVKEEGFSGRVGKVVDVAQEVGDGGGRLVSAHDAGHFLQHALQQAAEHGVRHDRSARAATGRRAPFAPGALLMF